MFRPGDVVEVEFSFAGIPIGDGKVIFTMVLRGITEIDQSFARVSVLTTMARNSAKSWAPTAGRDRACEECARA